MKFSAEQIAKAKNVKSVEELIALAEAEQVDLTLEEAKAYFAQLVVTSEELDDDELDMVSGGGCGGGGSKEPEVPADYGFPNGQRVYMFNGICDQCSKNGFYNASRNFTLEWIDQPGGNYRLHCEICHGIVRYDFFNGDPSVRLKRV